jgi:glycosyltransferase involved in cell wall biosynthesis
MVTPRYFPSVGGVETHVAQVATRVAAAGHDVTVLTTDVTGRLPPYEQREGVTIRRLAAWPGQRDWNISPGIYSEVRRGAWDVVHIQSYHTAVAPLAMLAAARSGIPYVVTFHGGGHSSRVRHRFRRVQLAALRPLLARAAALVAVAPFELDLYGSRLHLPRGRFVLIPNGADLPPAGATPRGARNGALIASVGRLERYKGHQHVLLALPHVLRRRPDTRLWIGGSGPYEPVLRELAAELGVADRVDIHAVPPENRQQLADELTAADVVVLASEFETHPVAAIEAAALGRPVVVADNSGLHDLVEQGVARAVSDERDPAELAVAILDELRHPTVPRAGELPSWDDCASRLCDLYARVAADAAP